MLVMAAWFGLALVFSFYVDQCHRVRKQIQQHYPDFFTQTDQALLVGVIANVNIYQSISDVQEFLDSNAERDRLPRECIRQLARIRYLKWIMLTYFCAMVLAAWLLG